MGFQGGGGGIGKYIVFSHFMHTEHNSELQQWNALLDQSNTCTDSDSRARGQILGIQQKGKAENVFVPSVYSF